MLGVDLPSGQPVDFTLRSTSPDGETRDIDSWSFYASRFDHFRHHMAWDAGGCLTVRYTPAGRVVSPPCAPVAASGGWDLGPPPLADRSDRHRRQEQDQEKKQEGIFRPGQSLARRVHRRAHGLASGSGDG
ncbi:MAG: hypothetical protein WDN06_01825 [Asticcacaulis sp.]